MNNLIISYDLKTPGQNYEKVAEAIKSLGDVWAKVQYSLWYVKSRHSASSAEQVVARALDSNDSLIVVDATNNWAAWRNLTPEVSEYLKQQWSQKAFV